MERNDGVATLTEIRAASRRLVRELGFLQHRWLPAGIGHSQCHALIELGAAGELSQGELAERLLLDKSTMSRGVAQLLRAGWVARSVDPEDGRRQPLRLTAAGRKKLAAVDAAANRQVSEALALLAPDEQALVVGGLRRYAQTLARARLQRGIRLRPITAADDAAVAAVIRTVMPEFGASGPGFALEDAEVDAMSAAYRGRRAVYFVVERAGRVLGGGGIAPLAGGDPGTCELRKMYLLREARGLGLGERLLHACLDAARVRGFRRCYLETLTAMAQARRLYQAHGFRRLERPEGATGHYGCNAWYALALDAASPPGARDAGA